MTHYNVDYSSLSGTRKRWKALLDTRDYTGRERYAKLRDIMRTNPEPNLDYWHMALSFAGIQGYPVKALYESYIGPISQA